MLNLTFGMLLLSFHHSALLCNFRHLRDDIVSQSSYCNRPHLPHCSLHDLSTFTSISRNRYPPELLRRFEVHFKTPDAQKLASIRDVKADKMGKLVAVRGIVTKATEVKPMMQVKLDYNVSN